MGSSRIATQQRPLAPSGAQIGPGPTSVIAEGALFEGNISCAGELELRVEGVVKGDVRVDHIVIGAAGLLEGAICAEVAEVQGRVAGSITAREVRLGSSCRVDGDIAHQQLSMELGAMFQGRSLRLQRPIKTPVVVQAEPPAGDSRKGKDAAPASADGIAA